MATFEPRDPLRTPGGYFPTSDFDSGGLSDPLFERHYAALPNLDEFAEAPPHALVIERVGLIASAVALVLMIALLFFPETVSFIVAR